MKKLRKSISIGLNKLAKRLYNAADKGRRGRDFRNAKSTSANTEIAKSLSDLRNRSRDMVRNNGWAKRAVEAVVKHTIGEGIRPAPYGNKSQNKKVKALWKEWAETTACDFYGKANFYGLQEQAMRGIVEGGDVIIILRWTGDYEDGKLPIKLQLCEGDLIDHTKVGKNEQGYANLGVQYSDNGELLGYWLWNAHPGEVGSFGLPFMKSEFVPKSDVLHCFEILRPGQSRGVPFGVAAFTKLADLNGFEDAHLFRQRMAANFCVFVERADDGENEDDDDFTYLEPGAIIKLKYGETVTIPNTPSVGDYDNYVTRILQGVSSAYGLTYEMLATDYSRVNFTSGRMAKIDVVNNFKSWQYNMIMPQMLDPIWEWFINACILTGGLAERIATDWTAPKLAMLDPARETKARIEAVRGGLTTLSEVIREDGREIGEFLEEYKQDAEMLAKYGLSLNSVAPLVQNTQNSPASSDKTDNNVVELKQTT